MEGEIMIHTDEKINYANYLEGKPQETDPAKLAAMKEAVVEALKARDVHGHITCKYYKDGRVAVGVDGNFYGVFDIHARKFFSGFVGD